MCFPGPCLSSARKVCPLLCLKLVFTKLPIVSSLNYKLMTPSHFLVISLALHFSVQIVLLILKVTLQLCSHCPPDGGAQHVFGR